MLCHANCTANVILSFIFKIKAHFRYFLIYSVLTTVTPYKQVEVQTPTFYTSTNTALIMLANGESNSNTIKKGSINNLAGVFFLRCAALNHRYGHSAI